MASRRAADEMIATGRIRVNDRRPPAQGMLIDPESDRVSVDGREITVPEGHRHLVMNKPRGYLVTATDPGRRSTIFDLLGEERGGRRLFAVGRLDMDTSGLLLLTDDGEMANRLAHPRHKVPKEYVAVVEGTPDEADLRRLREGVDLEDGRTAPARVDIVGGTPGMPELRLVIHEGRNRQIRRMLDAVGHPVRQLRRTAFGPIRLGRLKEGGVRRLRQVELESLRRAAGL